DGRAEFEIPNTEPDHGVVTVSGVEGAPAQVTYYRDLAACQAGRVAQLERANRASSGRTALLEAIPTCQTVTDGRATGERVWELAIGAAIAASRGECRAAHDAADAVKNLDASVYDAVYGHPEVAGCVAREAARQSKMTPCTLERADAMRAAQAIRD